MRGILNGVPLPHFFYIGQICPTRHVDELSVHVFALFQHEQVKFVSCASDPFHPARESLELGGRWGDRFPVQFFGTALMAEYELESGAGPVCVPCALPADPFRECRVIVDQRLQYYPLFVVSDRQEVVDLNFLFSCKACGFFESRDEFEAVLNFL